METLFINIVKSSGLIGIFYIAYYLLLRKETFFTSNRWFLLLGLLTSVILPWIVFTTVVWVKPTASSTLDLSKIPVAVAPVQEQSFEINWYLVLASAYAIGIVLFLTQFAFDFYNLKRVLKGKTFYRQADQKFIDLKENIAPFSYFNTIVYNSSLYSKSEMESILEHEKVHSEQYHTIDVLISRFFCIIFWFNPFIWLYQKAILQNLEFIADSEAAKNISDKKAYQLALLKITTQDNCVAITNHFYQSLIKKRIIMLNKNQSKKWNSWKYALMLPVLVGFVLLFQVEVVAQGNKSLQTEIKTPKNDKINLIITKNTTDEEINEHCKQIKKRYDIDLSFFNIKRNSKGEIITIESKFKDKTGSGSCVQSENTPIKPFKFFYDENKKEMGYINFDFTSYSKGKEIYIDGEKSSEDKLVKLDINEIEKVDAIKKADKTTLLITTKHLINNSAKSIKKSSHITPPPPPKVETVKFAPPTVTKNSNVATPPPPKVETIKFAPPTVKKNSNIAPPPPPALPPPPPPKVETVKFLPPKVKKDNNIAPPPPPKVDNHIMVKATSDSDSKKPLYIIDGKKMDPKTNINNIDPNSIESMTILKDKAAIEMYGEDGKNGVIIVTTKSNTTISKSTPKKE